MVRTRAQSLFSDKKRSAISCRKGTPESSKLLKIVRYFFGEIR
jgi:hypothetical protein